MHILTINAGSSSIKAVLFEVNDSPKRVVEAVVENIGQPTARLVVTGKESADNSANSVIAPDHITAAGVLTDWLKQKIPNDSIAAIGHRVVHGGPKFYEPCIIDDNVIANLGDLTLFDPQHLPAEIQLIKTFQKLFPNAKQIASFDTAFHHDLPTEARLFPIPRRYEAQGVRRYGFHGLSYSYLMQELGHLDGANTADGRLILIHMGSGVSLAAVNHGKSIDTTMGLTPASGVPMSTRSGDLDPGLAVYLARKEGLDADQFNQLVNSQSGLLGISETSADMKTLLEHKDSDQRARDAIDLFCYQIKKSIGSLAAALGGINTLVFTGGIGENAPIIRAQICAGLEFLGIKIDQTQNAANAGLISAKDSEVRIRIIHADEASIIAQSVWQIIAEKVGADDTKE